VLEGSGAEEKHRTGHGVRGVAPPACGVACRRKQGWAASRGSASAEGPAVDHSQLAALRPGGCRKPPEAVRKPAPIAVAAQPQPSPHITTSCGCSQRSRPPTSVPGWRSCQVRDSSSKVSSQGAQGSIKTQQPAKEPDQANLQPGRPLHLRWAAGWTLAGRD